MLPTVDHRVLEPIAEEPSFVEDDQLNSFILSFRDQFRDQVQDLRCDIPEPDATSDSCHGRSGNLDSSTDDEDDNMDMGFSDESLEKELQRLRPQKYAQNTGRKKPGSKRSSSQRGRSTVIPDVDDADPRTCGMYFLFWPYLFVFSLSIHG